MTDDRDEDSVTVRVLRGIREDLRTGLVGVTTRLDGLNQRVDGLERATIVGFEGVHHRLERLDTRLESIRDIAGERWRDHEDRIRKLETTVGR